jgi:hypothetical protein
VPDDTDMLLQRDGHREIGHGNIVSFDGDRVEMTHFGKPVKRMSRRQFIEELPLLAYLLVRDPGEKERQSA